MSERTDTERLDWMDKRLRRDERYFEFIGEKPPASPRFIWALGSDFPSLRETIDAMMDNEQ